MKKIFIAFIALILLSSAALVVNHTASDNYFWKGSHKFVNVPKVCNSGGTITDTLETKSGARSQLSGKLNTSTFTSYQADTITLEAAMLQYFEALPVYADNATALAALGAGKPYFLSTGGLAKTYTP